MKHATAFAFALTCMCICSVFTLSAQFSGGGTGTAADPFKIETATDLNNVRNYLGKHFRLMNDIDLTTFLQSTTKGWQPIGDTNNPFTGYFTGGGYRITGLWINDAIACVGFFGGNSGTIENLKITVAAKGIKNEDSRTGSFVGYNTGTITRCGVDGGSSVTISGAEYWPGGPVAGGFVGWNNGIISSCYATVSVSSWCMNGGFAGGNSGTITNCYATGNVTATTGGWNVTGGFVGMASGNDPSYTNCYSVGKVLANNTSKGAFAGIGNTNFIATVLQCYYNSDINGSMKGVGGDTPYDFGAKNTAQMKSKATFVGWDFNTIWTIDEGVSYPYFRDISNNITVTYNYNGATGGNTVANKEVTYNSAYGTLPEPTKQYTVTWNYNGSGQSNGTGTYSAVFGGWYKEDTFTNVVTSSTTVSTNSNHTLYAKWNAGTALTLPTPNARAGHVFNGWYTASSGGTKIGNAGASYTPTANTTLYAQWTEITGIIVTYNYNGATGGNTETYQTVPSGDRYKPVPSPVKQYTVTYNYNGNGQSNGTGAYSAVFGGWYKEAAFTNVVTSELTVTADHTIYAKWNAGTALTLPTPTARTGYVFAGWYTEASGGTKAGDAGAGYTPTATGTLYARWTPISYTVSYNGNGNTGGSTASSSHNYDESKALTCNGFTRAYTVTYNDNGQPAGTATATSLFDGWAKSSGGTKEYGDCQHVVNLTAANGTTIPLYAKWIAGTVTLPTPTAREGYTFTGWYTAESGGTNAGIGV